MSDFWELHWNSKKSGGGFIWALVDEAIVRTDFNNVLDANGLNANDGILGPHREKEGSYFALREIFSPVKIRMSQLTANFDGGIEVRADFARRPCHAVFTIGQHVQQRSTRPIARGDEHLIPGHHG